MNLKCELLRFLLSCLEKGVNLSRPPEAYAAVIGQALVAVGLANATPEQLERPALAALLKAAEAAEAEEEAAENAAKNPAPAPIPLFSKERTNDRIGQLRPGTKVDTPPPAPKQPADPPPPPDAMSEITIYHTPACGTSRNALALIRHAGIEPVVVEYLKTPPDKDTLRALAAATGQPVRALLREKGTPYAELGLDDPAWSDEQLLDAIVQHPILLNRPLVVTPLGTQLCRPSEAVLELLPVGPLPPFTKPDGEVVVDSGVRRVLPD